MADLQTLLSKFLNALSAGTLYASPVGSSAGVPVIRAAGRLTGQTAAIASVASCAVGSADGSFEVAANVLVTASTTHSFNVQCDYTDEGNTARTLVLNFVLVAGGAGGLTALVQNANGTVPHMGLPIRIRAKAGTSITIKTTGTFTTVTYNIDGSILQVA